MENIETFDIIADDERTMIHSLAEMPLPRDGELRQAILKARAQVEKWRGQEHSDAELFRRMGWMEDTNDEG